MKIMAPATNPNTMKQSLLNLHLFSKKTTGILRKTLTITLLLVVMMGLNSFGATYYWRTAAGNDNWSSLTAWSTVSAAGASAGTIPGLGDDVVIARNGNLTVTLDGDYSCNSLLINYTGGANGLISLTIPASTSLAVTNAITFTNIGNGNENASIDVSGGSLTCSSITMNDTPGANRDNYLLLSDANSIVTVSGNITMSGANFETYLLFTAEGTLNVGGTITGGAITSTAGGGPTAPTSGTVNYNDAGAQNIGNYTYYNLTVSTSGTKTLIGATTVRNLAIQGSAVLASDVYNITGNAAGTFTMDAGTALTLGNTGSATATTFPSNFSAANITLNNNSTVIYQSNGNQTVANAPAYGNLIIATSGTKTLAFDITVNNNLTIQGSSTLATGARQITGNGIGTLTMDAGTTLTLGSTSTTNVVNLPTFLAYSLNANSTIAYQANVGQTVSNTPVYGNLTLTTGGTATTKNASGNYNIAGNLIINNNATLALGGAPATWNIAGSATVDGILDFGTVLAKTLNLTGDLINVTGTINMTGAGLAHTLNLGGANNALSTLNTTAASGSNVNYTSALAQQVFASANYQNLTVSGGGTKSLQGATTVANTLTLTSGILQLGNNSLTISNNATNAIQGAAFSATNMIETNGTGYLIRNAIATLPIHFPIGAGGFYSPASIDAISATTGTVNARTEKIFTLGSKYLQKFWDVITSSAGKTITATFTYAPAEITTFPTEIYNKPNVTWQVPTGTKTFGANSFTITGTTDIKGTSTLWTAGPVPGTYFSYQTGNWDVPTTWTSDPGGTTQVGSTIPGAGDAVVILTSRTVTLPSDIAVANLEVNINEGGILDMATYSFTSGLMTLNGSGTLRLASASFPTATTNTFVNSGGGTTEYYNATDFTLPAVQTTYNNLRIKAPGVIATQMNDIILNGDLQVKQGTYRINDNTTAARRQLTINGNVTVDAGASMTVGTGVTNTVTSPLNIASVSAAPFINYYDAQSHRVVIKGNFTNNGTVKFTNIAYPIFNLFPPTVQDATTGIATVYFQGANDNTLTCNNTTIFYNLVLDKGVDQSFSLTVYSSAYPNFRLYGANIAGGDGGGSNPNLKKALWIRTGTLVLKGLTIIPSLSEGTCAEGVAASPNSDFYIPANGALTLDGSEVIVLSTADDYGEVNVAYGVAGGTGLVNGVGKGGCSSFSVYGKFKVNNGYFSTRESGGLITWSIASGQFVIRGGTVDAKQLRSAGGGGGLASYDQSAGTFILRGRFQHTLDYSNIAALKNTTLNTIRADGYLDPTLGTFNLNEATNVFTMSGGTVRIYDACGVGGRVFDVLSSTGNINVTDGTIHLLPTTGTGGGADAAIHYVRSNAPLGNVIIERASSATTVQLDTYPLSVIKNLTLTSGEVTANNLNVSVGGNFSIANGTTYTPGTNWTIFNGTGSQNFTINLATALALNKFKVDKPVGTTLTLSGSQTTISVADSMMIVGGNLADGGKTINLAGTIATASYLYNSGIHSGTGKIVLNDNVSQLITGDGNGIFQNLELNNNTGTAPISLGSNITVNGTLTLSQDKLFDLKTYNLKLGASATVVGASATRYIQTSGNAGDGGITKVYSSSATSFTFPVGAPTLIPARAVKYTPATIAFGTLPTTYGSITIVPVGYEHPNTTMKNRSLTYFWRVKSAGFTLGSATITHSYSYSQNDVVTGTGITEDEYKAAKYNNTTYTWTKGTVNDVDDAINNVIGGAGTTLAGVNYIDGEFTAGDDNGGEPFGTPTKFYSLTSGPWNVASTWSNTGHAGLPASTTPGANDVVVIGNNNTVTLTANASCASLQIETGAILDIYTYTGSTFSIVLSHPNGNGLFRVTTPATANNTIPGFFTFPSGDFTDFNVNSGTTEFYDIDGDVGALYILPANVTQYGNLIVRAKGGDNLVLPNNAYTTIYGDLTCTGDATTAWIAMSWNTNIWPYGDATAYNPTIEKTIRVMGNLNINAGSFEFFNDQTPQHLIVEGNVTIAEGAVMEYYAAYPFATPVITNTLAIGGSLINNNRVTLSSTSGGRAYNVYTTFFGMNSASITNTAGTPTTVFSNVTVNKGTSQADTLTINIGGTLTTPNDNWLTLQNGTLKYSRTDPGTDFTITRATPFTIPSTAGLYIDYPDNASNRNILIANSNVNTNDLYLNGKLTVANGKVYVGPINGTTVNNNDIEYSGGGASTIDIRGGNLIVNGQIRRNPSSTNGVLKYYQSGGNLIVNGQAAIPGNAKFEVENNPGSVFNMSGGTITIVRGGGTTFGDLYIRAASSTVTGGEIIFTQSPSIGPVVDAVQNYILDANVALNNLTITGKTSGTARNAKVTIFTSALTLNGDLMLSNANSILDMNTNLNINLTVKGGFTNNGAYNHYNNLTTFSGGIQSIQGNTATDFYNLLVNPVTSLTLIRDITVFNNLELRTGQLLNSTFNVNVKGNLINKANYDGDAVQGGVILNGSNLQSISGTGTFGRLELNNSAGATLLNDITLQKNFKLTTGIFDINEFLLTLGVNSSIEGSSFSKTKMITTDGVFSDLGLQKYFDVYSGPGLTFVYPLGTSDKYTPAVLTYTANTQVGYIRVSNVNSNHPGVFDPNNVLGYYWEVKSDGIKGVAGSLVFSYLQADVKVNGINTEAEYIAAALLNPPIGTSWIKSATGPTTDNVNETINTITFDYPLSDNLSGEYTCGIDAALPNNVPEFRSIADGDWNNPAIWEQINIIDPYVLTTGPNGFIVTISPQDTVSIDANYAFTYRMTINGRLRVVYPYMGNNFGTVYGNGTLYLESATFPAGRYTNFFDCANSATLEYGGTRSFTIIADLFSSIPKLHFTGTGVRALPNKDLTICTQLLIDGPTLDNSVSNKKLIIQGTMERYNTGAFICGSGAGAIVSFAGSAPQIIGGTLGDFSGANAFNHFEINNPTGLTINTGGAFEVGGNLLLTNGNITTNSTSKLTITNTAINCVTPSGGSVSSFVDGPLIKSINQGDDFIFPLGKDTNLGNKLTLSQTQTGTLLWTAEYFNPNPTYTSFTAPLTYVNSKDYWTINAPASSQAIVNLKWDPSSDLTPLMTQNGLTDMRVATYNTGTTKWEEITTSTASGNNNNGTVTTTSRITIPGTGTSDFSTACINVTKPRARLNPAAAVCGALGIPVSFTGVDATNLNYILNYEKGGVAQAPITVSALPFTLPTDASGTTYQLISFTYNNLPHIAPVVTGVVDPAIVTTYTVPTTATAGGDQSICGATSATLAGNEPTTGTGLWSIISGIGGTVSNPTIFNSLFTGTNGSSYTLRWTITNGGCSSFDDVIITFPLNPVKPVSFILSSSSVCRGQQNVLYSVANDPTVTYTWAYTGLNTVVTANGNSASLNFASDAGSGSLSVYTTNGCGNSAPLSMGVTVNLLPQIFSVTGGGAYCTGGTGVAVGLNGSVVGVDYTLYRDGVTTGNTVAGIGAVISFGLQTIVGTYTAIAQNTTTLCTENMNLSRTVTVNPLPNATIAINPVLDTLCNGDNTEIVIDFTAGASPFTVTISDQAAIPITQVIPTIAADPYTFSPATPPAYVDGATPFTNYYYTITFLTDNNGCTRTNIGNEKVTVFKIPETGPQYHVPNNFAQ
ncbi:beta strand repeat-containing protein [Williamwhitmania taraxaci]|uniref:PKD-like domain-containing protein n=1 Tax=Williamwhitmania taraxaci TaxID=1640674 RepID=A0A1G6GH39_9BACT|nr:hypothetical protein [Williamwhitmania taraxaci]SDB81321.1 hypothetical protein SAMN05216323_100158 [Williamwhitmania taraxaci]